VLAAFKLVLNIDIAALKELQKVSVSDVADRQADYVRCNDHCKFPKRLLN
jgi:hypothetical protein